MFTNLATHGGVFFDELKSEFASSKNVTIASGYTSLDIIDTFAKDFIRMSAKGGIAKLMLGMAFYEGLSQKKLDAVSNLHIELQKSGNGSGVYVANGRRYHGKVYHFYDNARSSIYVGSSNFSSSGTKSNIECTIPVHDNNQKNSVIRFLDDLYSTNYSISIDLAEIIVPGKTRTVKKTIENYWKSIKRYDPLSLDFRKFPSFDFDLTRISEKEKSNLNVFFGKGRWNSSNDKVTPRPWYEIELIANKEINGSELYPKGDFTAYTDDGYVIPMKTQGDYFKNIRSKKSLQIFGIWLKGKLERSGALTKYEPVTKDTLDEYGNSNLTFHKISDSKYYLKF